MNPIRYSVRLEPDLQTFEFSGNVEILMESPSPISEIVLNTLEIAYWRCQINIEEQFRECPFCVDPEKETLNIRLPKEMSGLLTVRIDFKGIINNKMAGFYRSQYVKDGNPRFIAVTQFEESDARRAFPCMDHPLKKAEFDIELIVDEGLSAISNTDIESEESLGHGKKRVRFRRTPRMSTYLVFFGVGEFEFKLDEIDARVRSAALPGLSEHTRFALDFGRKSLRFCENYYDIAYPLPKMDLIAVPDFAFGAMENWGAITFRENLLLRYPGITARSGEGRICEIIAHEIVHQWFGNLVSPSDWKYLWLNESFATYFAYHVVEHYQPDWEYWSHFLQGQTEGAFSRDALHNTIPIEIPGGQLMVINSGTAPIIYNKGGSLLRQIEGFIGAEQFRKGLYHYLKTHAYKCAESQDLWKAFEAVSSQNITAMVKSWIGQPGFPIITAKRDGNKLILTQSRFTHLPNDSAQTWMIPVIADLFGKDGSVRRISALMEDKTLTLDIGDAIVCKVNAGQFGFYRVRYDSFDAFGNLILSQKLSAQDRWGLQNDLYALVRSGEVSIGEYLQFLTNYKEEKAFLPLTSIAGNLYHAFLVTDERKKIADFGKSLIERVLEDIGYEPVETEAHTVSVLRDQLLWTAVLFGSEPAEKFASAKFRDMMRGESVHPDIMRSVMQTGALTGDDAVSDWFCKKLESSSSEYERMNILGAIACFRNKSQIERACQYVLDTVPDRNKFVPLTAMMSNPFAIPYMWDWYVSHIAELEKMHPLLYERIIGAVIPYCGIEHSEAVKAFFTSYIEKCPNMKDIVDLSLEKLEIHLRMRQ